jgi:hypothetical protein
VPAYRELYPAGSEVRVAPADRLLDFRRTWRYHNPLQEAQLPFAGAVAKVARVGFYHGGDVLYTLENVPGVWHEACLSAADTSNAV